MSAKHAPPPESHPKDASEPIGLESEPAVPDTPEVKLSRRGARAEQEKLFYERLSQKVLEYAGISLENVPSESPAEDEPEQKLQPRNMRQKAALHSAYNLAEKLKTERMRTDFHDRLRRGVDASKRKGTLRWTPVTKEYIAGQQKALREQYQTGEIDEFELKNALGSVGRPSSPMHGLRYRLLTYDERAGYEAPNEFEQKSLEELSRLKAKALRLADRGKPGSLGRRLRGHADNISRILEPRIDTNVNWQQALDVDRIADFRAHVEQRAEQVFDDSIGTARRQIDKATEQEHEIVHGINGLLAAQERVNEEINRKSQQLVDEHDEDNELDFEIEELKIARRRLKAMVATAAEALEREQAKRQASEAEVAARIHNRASELRSTKMKLLSRELPAYLGIQKAQFD